MKNTTASLAFVAAVIAPLALAHAATEVIRLPANNRFASAVSTAPDGTSTGVFVTRQITGSGGPVDSIFFIISTPDGGFTFGGGTLPQGAFQINAQAASLVVDINAITLDTLVGTIPANGVIDIDWAGTDTQRTSGSTQFNFGTTHVVITGTRVDVVADVSGTVFGTALFEPTGTYSSVTQSVIIVTRD